MSAVIKFVLPGKFTPFGETICRLPDLFISVLLRNYPLTGCIFVLSVSGILNTPAFTRRIRAANAALPRYVPLRMKHNASVPENG